MSPENRRRLLDLKLRHLAATKKPILVGPWRSEVGFEALYWLPFLKWAVQRYKLDLSRFVVVTRGGMGLLYGGAHGADLYALRSVDSVRAENLYDYQDSLQQKQLACTPWDRDVLKEAAAQVVGRGQSYHILHPSWMYACLAPFWEEHRGMHYLQSMTDFAPIPKLPVTRIPNLPQKYVAMRWYSRATFNGQHPDVQQYIQHVTAMVATQTPVVLLNQPHAGDDHTDVLVEHPNVISLPALPADQNLAVQAQVLSHATAFVGTYGGAAQLALRLGVPSVSAYHEWGGTMHQHLSLSLQISKATKVPFLVGSIDDAKIWQQVLSLPGAPPPVPVVEGQLVA